MIASVVTGLHVPVILSCDVAERPPSLLVGPEQVRVGRNKMVRQRYPDPLTLVWSTTTKPTAHFPG